MINPISRIEIFHHKKIIASEISKLQKAFYDDEEEYSNSEDTRLYIKQFDALQYEELTYATFNKIISINHHEIETFTVKLSEHLKCIFQFINSRKIFVLSHLKLDLFGNKSNKYAPLENAYQKLEKLVGCNSFSETLVFDIENLQEIIEILFWIIRCDPSVPEYISLFDENEQLSIFLCKYGNIHLAEFNKEQLTNHQLEILGWSIIEGQETDNFSDNGKIIGRQLKVD
ncbi:MAG: hypothetical protein R2739_09235 [Chitinophagales bacterium]|nr:hypothetical protein [Bacteroidota bacterium]